MKSFSLLCSSCCILKYSVLSRLEFCVCSQSRYSSTISLSPLVKATSNACRIALSTLEAVVSCRRAISKYKERKEKDDTLRLTLAVGEILEAHGLDVQYTRTTDIYESPYQKAMEANNAGVDFFVSIHRNSFPSDNAVSGVESLVYDKSGIKLRMAENINEQLEDIGFVNLGVKARPNLVVLKRTKMPAVLVEVGFINSDVDNKLFDENFEEIAQAIAYGILDTLESNHEVESPGYEVQVGAYRNERYAQNLLEELLEQDFPAYIVEGDRLYRVRVGNYITLEDAARMEQMLKRAGYPTVIVST